MGTHYEGNKDDQRTLDAFIKLMRATETINNRLNRHLAEADLTVSQFGVMEALYHLGELNQKELGDKLLKSGGNITMVIGNLEKCGYISRRRDPHDGRAILITLTETGEELISSLFPRHLNQIKEEFDVLTGKEKEELSRICKKLGLKEG